MPNDFEEITQEVQEHEKRKCNVIIYNIAEIRDEVREDRVSYDKIKVNEVLQSWPFRDPYSGKQLVIITIL